MELKKRLLSLLWRAGALAIITFLATIATSLDTLGLPVFATGMVSLVISEITKFLNKKYQLGGRLMGRKQVTEL